MYKEIQLGIEEYKDKVYGCWLGKNIGGTLGEDFECKKHVNNLTFYWTIPEKSSPNDDLDLQLVWLKMLEDKNAEEPALSDFADYWLKYLCSWPPDEYGLCLRNLERGLRPPVSGCFENGYIDNMGSPIRSEIWACIAPGDPQLAASLAVKDALLDHAGGEGVYGEMFWAAVESAAFVISDVETLIQIGLSMIPISSQISRVIRQVLWLYDNGVSWADARHQIATLFSNPAPPIRNNTGPAMANFGGYAHPCLAAPNHGFTVIGWLYGKDFGDSLCKAVNCGYDTDCTGATLGALLGIIHGAKNIPEKWKNPIGKEIILHPFTGKCDAPKTLIELTERTGKIAEKFIQERSDIVSFGTKTIIPKDILSSLFRNEKARKALTSYDVHSAIEMDEDMEITLHYNGEPVLRLGIRKEIDISLKKDGLDVTNQAKIELKAPKDWKVRKKKDGLKFELYSEKVKPRNQLKVKAKLDSKDYSAEFTILGPQEAKGWPVERNVERCPKCRARKGACQCQERRA
ncbi:MAG: ADP-ribosylglycohydrolase family protein [bacterium]